MMNLARIAAVKFTAEAIKRFNKVMLEEKIRPDFPTFRGPTELKMTEVPLCCFKKQRNASIVDYLTNQTKM